MVQVYISTCVYENIDVCVFLCVRVYIYVHVREAP